MKTLRLLALGALVVFAGCRKDTPLGDVDSVEGRYSGIWTLSWNTNNPNLNPPGETALCPGSITIGDEFRGTFSGAFLILDEDDCADGSPISGELIAGRSRVDGGVNFTLQVPPPQGQEKLEEDIWEDIFAGSGVILPELILGCVVQDTDNQMSGAVLGARLAGSASGAVLCQDVPATPYSVLLQIRFDGSR